MSSHPTSAAAGTGCVLPIASLMGTMFADVSLLVGMLALILHVLTCDSRRRPVVGIPV